MKQRPLILPQTLQDRMAPGPLTLRSYGIADAYTQTDTNNRLPGILEPVRIRREFGLRGDGESVQSAVVQDVLDAAKDRKLIVNFGDMILPIDGPLFLDGGPGFFFDKLTPEGAADGPGFLLTGSGYTALTVSKSPQVLSVALTGTSNTMNGVLFENPLLARFQHIRVRKLDGFGVKINSCWDCMFETISVEECGNASEYAFSLNSGVDTSNMSHFMHIQVELANRKAIYVQPSTLCCVIDSIHSERAAANASDVTWSLGGGSCTYNNVRLQADSGSASCDLVSGGNTYTNLRVEGNIPVEIDAFVLDTTVLVNPNLEGTLSLATNQTGPVAIYGGKISTLSSSFIRDDGPNDALRIFSANRAWFGSVYINDCENPPLPELVEFSECSIDDLDAVSTTSAVTLRDCVVREGNNLPAITRMFNTQVTCASTLDRANTAGLLYMRDSTLTASLYWRGNSAIRLFGSKITGTVAKNDAGTTDFIADAHSTVGGSSTDVSAAPTGGAHLRGETHYDPLPSASTTPGWRCTAAGTPGTWKSFAALSA